MELLIIRHGATEWSALGKHTGRTDLPMTPEGEAEVKALAPLVAATLAGRTPARVLCSPLQRTRATAAVVLPDVEVVETDLVREFDYGAFEGRTRREIQQDNPEWTIWTHGCPEGETVERTAERADRALAGLESLDGPVAVVAHGHFSRILAARALRLPGREGRLFGSETASLAVVADHHGQRCVTRWNARAEAVGRL